MIKFLEKKIIERIIKDVIKTLPDLKAKGLALFEEKKGVFIAQIRQEIKKKVVELVQKL